MTVRLYPFGFIGSTNGFATRDLEERGFRRVRAWEDLDLLVQGDTKYEVCGTGELGIIWIGIGTSLNSEVVGATIAEQAYHHLSEGLPRFHEFLDFVVGRWAAIVSVKKRLRIYNDTLALQPVYVSRDSFLFCSHLPLLTEELDKRSGSDSAIVDLGQHKLWDETEDRRISALPANHFFDSALKRIVRFYPHHVISRGPSDYPERIDEVIEMSSRSVKFWAQQPYQLYVALTAGLDTRLCLAATLKAGIDATCVTYGSKEPPNESDRTTAKSYKTDVAAAQQISRDFDLDGIILAIEEASKHNLTDGEKKILSANNLGRHALSFQGLYEAHLGRVPSICFVGSGLETVKDYYVSTERISTPRDEFVNLVKALGRGSGEHPYGELNKDDFGELWNQENMDAVSASGFPINNLVFWELRASRFQSEAINCQATAFMPINPLAFRALFEVGQLLHFYERKNSRFYWDFIAGSAPRLLSYEVNGTPFEVPKHDCCQLPLAERKSSGETPTERVQIPPDIIQLSADHLSEGAEIFFWDQIDVDYGALLVGFHSRYDIGKQVRNIEIFLRVNGAEVWSQGIGLNGIPVFTTVAGLKRGDALEFGLRSTRDNGVAWSNVSKIKLLKWQCFDQKYETDLKVRSTSFANP